MQDEFKEQLLRIIYKTPKKLLFKANKAIIVIIVIANILVILGMLSVILVKNVILIRIVITFLLIVSLYFLIGFLLYLLGKDVLFIERCIESRIKKDLRIVLNEKPIVIEENGEEVALAICFKSRRSPLDPRAILEVKQIGDSYLFYAFPALTVYQITDENKLQQLLTDKIIAERLHTSYDEKDLELITDEMIQTRVNQPKERFEKLYPTLQSIWITSMLISCVIIFWFPGL